MELKIGRSSFFHLAKLETPTIINHKYSEVSLPMVEKSIFCIKVKILKTCKDKLKIAILLLINIY